MPKSLSCCVWLAVNTLCSNSLITIMIKSATTPTRGNLWRLCFVTQTSFFELGRCCRLIQTNLLAIGPVNKQHQWQTLPISWTVTVFTFCRHRAQQRLRVILLHSLKPSTASHLFKSVSPLSSQVFDETGELCFHVWREGFLGKALNTTLMWW